MGQPDVPAAAPADRAAPVPDGAGAPHRPLNAPVLPMEGTLTQPDGTTVQARTWGDERTSGYETLDGYTIVRAGDGSWEYAAREGGELVPSGVRVVDGGSAPDNVAPSVRPDAVAGPADASGADVQADASTAPARGGRHTGRAPTLVLLVDFQNRPSVGTSAAHWSSRFFGSSASLRHFYTQASYGAFTVVPATETHGTVGDGVVGWLRLPYNHPDNRATGGSAMERVVADAIRAADRYVDFAAYDTNGDGRIATRELHIAVVVAGYESAYGGSQWACAPNTGAHKGTVYEAPTVDGRVVGGMVNGDIGGYTLYGEFHCHSSDSPGHQASLGVIAHEYGHDIGWPDLYDTGDMGAEDPLHPSHGVGQWSIMGGGIWNSRPGGFSGSTPALPDAFLKAYHGWVIPRLVEGTVPDVPVDAAATTPSVTQVLVNPEGVDWTYAREEGTGEYFLIENRQLTGYDAGLPGCGLLIWHIDESVEASWAANAIETHKLVDLEEADGLDDLDTAANTGDTGDPYPGTTRKTLFAAPPIHPDSNLYTGAPSGVTVTIKSAGCASRMLVDVAAPTTPICPPDDGFEPNDTHASAIGLTSGEPIHGIVCNDDYYSITAGSGETITAALSFTHSAAGDLDMRLYDPAGTQVAASESRDNDERISYAVPAAGTYVVRVYGKSASRNRYVLSPTVDDATPPAGSVTINSGEAYAYGSAVTLALPASDAGSDVVEARLSNSVATSGGVLTSGHTRVYAATTTWSLTDARHGGTSATGAKTVYVQYRDRSGNWSRVFSDSITYAADASGTCAGATTARPLGSWQYETIYPAGDHDWFRFDTSVSQYGWITLARPMADYRLDVYNSSCALVASSTNPGTQFELIYRHLPAGRYFVRVAPSATGAASVARYGPRFQSLTESVHVMSTGSPWTDTSGRRHLPGEVLNNTPSHRNLVKITATLYNSSNAVIGTTSTYTFTSTVGARNRSPFELVFTPPSGYHRHSLTVSSQVTGTAPIGNVAATLSRTTDEAAGRRYEGSLENNNAFSVRDASFVVTLYDAYGYVIGVGRSAPTTIAAGATVPFQTTVTPYAGAVRAGFKVNAIR